MESKKVLQTRATKASQSEKPAQQEEIVSSDLPKSSHSIVEKETTSRFSDLASTSNAKKATMSPMRYSQMDEDSSETRKRLLRVGIFVAVIIALAVGAILVIENSSKQSTSNGSQPSSTTSAANIVGYEIARTVLTDDNAGAIPRSADFNTAKLSLGSAANLNENIIVSNVQYKVFSSLSRLTWELDGLTNGFPATTVEYTAATKKLIVTFAGIDVANAVMLTTVPASIGPVKSITAALSESNVEYTVEFNEDIKYAPALNTANNTLELNIKTNVQLNATSASSTVSSATSSAVTSSVVSTTSAASSASATSTAAVGEKLDNTFSRGPQTISSGLANTIAMRSYFYQDFGPHFEFSWTFNGTGVNSVSPKATAEYIVEDGANYIEVKIEGVTEDYFQAMGKNEATFENINTTYANILKVIFRGRTNNVSTYWVRVKGLADFRLHSTGERNGQQKLTLEIKD